MTRQTAVVHQVSWVALTPQIIALVTAMAVATYFLGQQGMMFGVLAYLAYSISSRLMVPWYHRRGIALVKRQQFEDAIPLFEKSLEFFDQNSWIDRFRSIVLMSPSAVCYREMALANIGFCHAQIGNGTEARQSYERCLQRFPDSGLATAALRMMDTGAESKIA